MEILVELLNNYAGFIGLVLSAIFSWMQIRCNRPKRALICAFSREPLPVFETTADEDVRKEIKCFYRGQPADGLFIFRARVENVGNVPILSSEVIQPVRLEFESDAEFLHGPRIIESRPRNLGAVWQPAGAGGFPTRQVSLECELLNPSDSLMAEFVCAGDSQLPEPSARVVGIPGEGIRKVSPAGRLSLEHRKSAHMAWRVVSLVGLLGSGLTLAIRLVRLINFS